MAILQDPGDILKSVVESIKKNFLVCAQGKFCGLQEKIALYKHSGKLLF